MLNENGASMSDIGQKRGEQLELKSLVMKQLRWIETMRR